MQKMLLLAAAACAAFATAPACADVYDFDYTGTILNGTSFGSFGAQETNLDGALFDALFSFTYPSPNSNVSTTQGLVDTYGGTAFGTAASQDPVTAVLTVNGRSIPIGLDGFAGEHFVYNGPARGQVSDFAGDKSGDSIDVTLYALGAVSSDPSNASSVKSITSSDPNYYFSVGSFLLADGTNGSLQASSLKVSDITAPTPEPAAWITMIFGLGAVGFIAWRRKRVAKPAFSSMKPA